MSNIPEDHRNWREFAAIADDMLQAKERIAHLEQALRESREEVDQINAVLADASSHLPAMTTLEQVKELVRSRQSFADMWKREANENSELEEQLAELSKPVTGTELQAFNMHCNVSAGPLTMALLEFVENRLLSRQPKASQPEDSK